MNSNHLINEPARKLPVPGSYDLAVAGAGIAGISAAVAAARNSVSVCLIDKASAVGGLATLGNVSVWLPLCDGRGRQVIGGLAEEMLKLSVEDIRSDDTNVPFRKIPECWRQPAGRRERAAKRYQVVFNPASYMLALEKLAIDAGVELMYDTRVCSVIREAGVVTHLIIENKSGRSAIGCRSVVDATGDADVCFLAGERTESLDSNVLCGWFYYFHDGRLCLDAMSNDFSPYATREGATPPFYRGDDARQVTDHILKSRELIRTRMAEIRAQNPQHDVHLVSSPAIASFRMTRRLVAQFSLGERHVHTWFDDTVGLTGDWRKAGPVYAVPLRALRAQENRNLIAAGRCISAGTTVWDVTRAVPTCALTGEAAGNAAAFTVRQTGGNFDALSIPQLQEHLKNRGMILDPELVKPAPDPAE